MKRITFNAIALCCFAISGLKAQTYNWTGGFSSDFYSSSNWSSTSGAVVFDDSSFKTVRTHNAGTAPIINQVIAWQPGIFDATGGNLTINADFNCYYNDWLNGNITINSGATFTCRNIIRVGREGQGAVTVNGTLRANNTDTWQGIFIGALANGNGAVTVNNGGVIDGGYQVEVGTRNYYPTGVLTINEGATSWAYWNTVIGPNGTLNVNGGTVNCGQGLIVGDVYVDNAGTEGSLGTVVGTLNINSGMVIVNHNDLTEPYFGLHDNAKVTIDNGALKIMRTGVDFSDNINAHITAGRIVAVSGKELVVNFDGTYTTVTAQSTASVNQFSKGFAVYPNPATDNITITNTIDSIVKLSIFDELGKEVLNTEISGVESSVGISSLMAGIYIVKLQSNNLETVIKLVKK